MTLLRTHIQTIYTHILCTETANTTGFYRRRTQSIIAENNNSFLYVMKRVRHNINF